MFAVETTVDVGEPLIRSGGLGPAAVIVRGVYACRVQGTESMIGHIESILDRREWLRQWSKETNE